MTEVIEAPGTSIALVVNQTPAIVLTDKKSRDEFYAHVQAEVDAFEPDLSTDKGRKAIASLAYKIARTKTAIDDAGKKLNEEARAKINAVDAERRAVREHFDALSAKVRQPLTEWEEGEKKRLEFIDNMVAMFRAARVVEMGETSASIRERGAEIYKTALAPDVFGDRLDDAQREKDETVAVLKAAMDRAIVAEKEAEELARLRAENEARERAEREKAEAERIERERKEAERRAEEARADAEAEEARRVEVAAKEAEERAREEERRKHEAELAAERERAERAEAEAQAERDRIAAEEAERAAREADKAHRTKVMGEAKAAIMTCGVDEETARKVVLLIKAGEVPHVRMEF
jgi:colicin import membrane protein